MLAVYQVSAVAMASYPCCRQLGKHNPHKSSVSSYHPPRLARLVVRQYMELKSGERKLEVQVREFARFVHVVRQWREAIAALVTTRTASAA